MRVSATILSASCRAAASRSLICRQFSSSSSSKATWGFIGLGQMGMYLLTIDPNQACTDFEKLGYNMAKNLRQKLPKEDMMIIQDINTNATKKFVEETPGQVVVIADNVREVAEKAVSNDSLFVFRCVYPK
jgi:hypothetical protein